MSGRWAELVREPLRDLGRICQGRVLRRCEAPLRDRAARAAELERGTFRSAAWGAGGDRRPPQRVWKYPRAGLRGAAPRSCRLAGRALGAGAPGPRHPGACCHGGVQLRVARRSSRGAVADLRSVRAACQAAGAVVERVDGADLNFDLARIAAVARETDAASSGSVTRTTRPGPAWSRRRLDALPRLLARAVCGRCRRSLCRLCPGRGAHAAPSGRRGRAPGDRAAHVLEDLRAGRAQAGLCDRPPRARALPAFGSGAVQCERRRAGRRVRGMADPERVQARRDETISCREAVR